jgi:hypothetical protein
MNKTISTTNGTPYITLLDSGECFQIQLHRYGEIFVTLDKKVVPEMIEFLMEIGNESCIF